MLVRRPICPVAHNFPERMCCLHDEEMSAATDVVLWFMDELTRVRKDRLADRNRTRIDYLVK